ncbi:TPA: hypothetical protein ACFNMW_001649 [Neisseria lactamica]|uniref:hypothetical protein n=1 Tax=Neisseria lactamica TaxID=486 RepID=UPI001863C415|nr:hypothetical protein [Neisseria lactamica]
MQDGGTPAPVQQNTPAAGKRKQRADSKKIKRPKPNLPEMPPLSKTIAGQPFFQIGKYKTNQRFHFSAKRVIIPKIFQSQRKMAARPFFYYAL